MNRTDRIEVLEPVKDAARIAGRAIQAIEPTDTDRKADGSPVTAADRAAHDVIFRRLEALGTGWPIVSEEGADALPEAPSRFWLVDPLDGTKEFLAGNGEYTVNIALIDAGYPVLGVVGVPALGALYWGTRGGGAWKEEGTSGPLSIRPDPRRGLAVAAVSRSHASEATHELLKALGVTDVVRLGSSAKMCAVAEGRADVYPRLGRTCVWDTAAGSAVALAAGCTVVQADGSPLRYGLDEGIYRYAFVVCATTEYATRAVAAMPAVLGESRTSAGRDTGSSRG